MIHSTMNGRTTNYSEFSKYCRSLLEKVKRETGFSLRCEIAEIENDEELLYANRKQKFHVLKYYNKFAEHLEHLILKSCYKLLRIWQVPPENRYIVAIEMNAFSSSEQEEFFKKAKEVFFACDDMVPASDEKVKKFWESVQNKLISILTRLPQDLRIEMEILKELSNHRGKQKRYLITILERFLWHLDSDISSLLPETIDRAFQTMYLAYSEEVSEIFNISSMELLKTFKEQKFRRDAENLRSILHSVKEPGLLGDKNVIDAWAKALGLGGSYRWVMLDN